MGMRVYMLLDIIEERSACTMHTLKTMDGVIFVDELEGHPNILTVVEAADRQKLVELMMPILDSIDRLAIDVHLLVNRKDTLIPNFDMANMEYFQAQSVN